MKFQRPFFVLAGTTSLTGEAQDVVVPVDVTNQSGEVVVHADITMYVSPKRKSELI
jgi:hypothetical protein